jgi:glutamate--cysteine ligase
MTSYKKLQQRLTTLVTSEKTACLADSLIGLEKESMRVGPDGKIAQTPHPVALGSALCNPDITTDYSEALIEFITPPLTGHNALPYLQNIQKFVYQQLDNEILWATSMPCVVAGETSIPIAEYGTSNMGVMKTVYRRGLGHRYGRMMQVISGVHFNFSLPESFWPTYQALENNSDDLQDFISGSYFATIRNLQRFGWLVPYLFGASPAVCKSFLGGITSTLQEFDTTTYYEPYATSLRMGDIGYQNNKESESGVKACYDNIDAYVSCLTQAINTVCPEHEKIGIVVNGEYQQLNANILQIENEYYSSVRPKQILNGNEKPTLALKRRGVKYIELRSLDINPFDPLGINEEQLYFLEAFVVFCLLHDSPSINAQERKEIDHNALITAHRGREPSLELQRNGETQTLKSWATELTEEMLGVCEILDKANNTNLFTISLQKQKALIDDPDKTPSARMLTEMRQHNEGFFHNAMRMSQTHYEHFKNIPLDKEQSRYFLDTVKQSLQDQKELENANNTPFDVFLAEYFAQE